MKFAMSTRRIAKLKMFNCDQISLCDLERIAFVRQDKVVLIVEKFFVLSPS